MYSEKADSLLQCIASVEGNGPLEQKMNMKNITDKILLNFSKMLSIHSRAEPYSETQGKMPYRLWECCLAPRQAPRSPHRQRL